MIDEWHFAEKAMMRRNEEDREEEGDERD